MLTGFPRTRWPRLQFSESYAVRISVKISRICEFRVIMGIMTGLLGCCSSSTLGSRANDYVKTLASFALLPRVLDKQHTRSPVIIPGLLSSGFLWSRWRGKHSRHSRRMCNPQFSVSGKRPIRPTTLTDDKQNPELWYRYIKQNTASY